MLQSAHLRFFRRHFMFWGEYNILWPNFLNKPWKVETFISKPCKNVCKKLGKTVEKGLGAVCIENLHKSPGRISIFQWIHSNNKKRTPSGRKRNRSNRQQRTGTGKLTEEKQHSIEWIKWQTKVPVQDYLFWIFFFFFSCCSLCPIRCPGQKIQ